MKDQEQIPEEVIQLQKERLSQDEFNFCKKLFDAISKMPALTAEQKKNILDYIKQQSNDKYQLTISEFTNPPKELQIYNLFLNKKNCFIVFDLLKGGPANIIPSGVLLQRTDT
jgi:hypothetical protein